MNDGLTRQIDISTGQHHRPRKSMLVANQPYSKIKKDVQCSNGAAQL